MFFFFLFLDSTTVQFLVTIFVVSSVNLLIFLHFSINWTMSDLFLLFSYVLSLFRTFCSIHSHYNFYLNFIISAVVRCKANKIARNFLSRCPNHFISDAISSISVKQINKISKLEKSVSMLSVICLELYFSLNLSVFF